MLFGDFGKNKGEEVADPYFKGMAEFETNLRQIVRKLSFFGGDRRTVADMMW